MRRIIAAFLVVLTLLLPGLSVAHACAIGGEQGAVTTSQAGSMVGSDVDGESASVGQQGDPLTSPLVPSTHDDTASPNGEMEFADAHGDMPVLLQSHRSSLVLGLESGALPGFAEADAPAPWLEGPKRPPRGALVSA